MKILGGILLAILLFQLFQQAPPALADELTPQLLCERSPWKGKLDGDKVSADIEVFFSCKKDKLSAGQLKSVVTKSINPFVSVGNEIDIAISFIKIEEGVLTFYNSKLIAQYEMKLVDGKLRGTAYSPTNSGKIELSPGK